MAEGSTCGRAGRRFLRKIVLVFFGIEWESSSVGAGTRLKLLLVMARVVLGEGGGEADGGRCEVEERVEGMVGGIKVSTSAIKTASR